MSLGDGGLRSAQLTNELLWSLVREDVPETGPVGDTERFDDAGGSIGQRRLVERRRA